MLRLKNYQLFNEKNQVLNNFGFKIRDKLFLLIVFYRTFYPVIYREHQPQTPKFGKLALSSPAP